LKEQATGQTSQLHQISNTISLVMPILCVLLIKNLTFQAAFVVVAYFLVALRLIFDPQTSKETCEKTCI
jgi:uncharacterized membrane protein